MSETPGPIHEIAFGFRGDDADAVDERLEVFVDELTRQAGFAGIEVWSLEDADETDRRVIRLAFADDAHWRIFMDERSDAIRTRLAAVAGDATDISERTLRGTEVSSAIEPPRCLNCDRILTGQYCGGCGQRGQSRLISLVELVKDAFGDLFELDSRLWQTLIP
ncbi:MAG: hypothetical protein R3315_08500, partial [Woeseiaceae bacterium]|nr:hypothetical protein [Woeseiaceae bacterium]